MLTRSVACLLAIGQLLLDQRQAGVMLAKQAFERLRFVDKLKRTRVALSGRFGERDPTRLAHKQRHS